MYSHARKQLLLEEFVEFFCGNFNLSVETARQIFTTSPDINAKDMIEPRKNQTCFEREVPNLQIFHCLCRFRLAAFAKKVKKRLTYFKLIALEAAGHLTEYPPKSDREASSSGEASAGIGAHNREKSD